MGQKGKTISNFIYLFIIIKKKIKKKKLQSGGDFFNLKTASEDEAAKSVGKLGFLFFGVQREGVAIEEVYPSVPTSIRGWEKILGIFFFFSFSFNNDFFFVLTNMNEINFKKKF